MALRNARARLIVLRTKFKETKDNKEKLEEKFVKVEKEKEDMYSKFERAIEQLKNKADFKN